MIETALSVAAESELTTEEITQCWRHLCTTRDRLIETVTGLSESQWGFKPTPETWSITEILEHLVIMESRVHAIVRNMSNAPPAEEGRIQRSMDEIILTEVAKRSIKVKAPTPVCPESRWSGTEALQLFIERRGETLQLLGAPLLRGRVLRHPFFGPWDGYQWLLAAASHSARHTDQIREVKDDPRFA